MKTTWFLLAFLSGAFLPIQAGLNAKMGKALENPVYGSAVSFLVGLIAISLYIVATRQPVYWQGLKTVPMYAYVGGVLGAFYVTAIILAFPKIGPALTFGLVVAGQMVLSVLLDHFGILVNQAHPIYIWRIAGILLIVAGVVLIRKF